MESFCYNVTFWPLGEDEWFSVLNFIEENNILSCEGLLVLETSHFKAVSGSFYSQLHGLKHFFLKNFSSIGILWRWLWGLSYSVRICSGFFESSYRAAWQFWNWNWTVCRDLEWLGYNRWCFARTCRTHLSTGRLTDGTGHPHILP